MGADMLSKAVFANCCLSGIHLTMHLKSIQTDNQSECFNYVK